MQFSSFAEFIAMGGHGFYVWLSYGISASLLGLLVLFSLRNNQKVIKQIRLRQKRELKLKQAAHLHQDQDQVQQNNDSQEVSS